jgi:hypothetical protein
MLPCQIPQGVVGGHCIRVKFENRVYPPRKEEGRIEEKKGEQTEEGSEDE